MNKTYSSRTADKFVVRLPDGMRADIQGIAVDKHRSMNSQIISWLEVCIELEDRGMDISQFLNGGELVTETTVTQEFSGPDLDKDQLIASLERMLGKPSREKRLEQMLEKLLGAGDWYSSAIELDRYAKPGFDGEDLKKEVEALLAETNPEKAVEKPKFYPREGQPVQYEREGKIHKGVVESLHVILYDEGEKFHASIRTRSGHIMLDIADLTEL